VSYLTQPKDLDSLRHKGLTPKVMVSGTMNEDDLKRVFSTSASGGGIAGNHWNFGKRLIGKPITWEIRPGNEFVFVSSDSELGDPTLMPYQQQVARLKGNPFKSLLFRRLLADRDIVPEVDGPLSLVQSNGAAATNAIQNFITKSSLPSHLVERVLLEELNRIFEPDGKFTDILVQNHGDGRWEIYLEEQSKGRVPLSQTGSGLKTILLVLVFLYLVPFIDKEKPLSDYLFGFEELENNLHPALQRRLLLYLRQIAIEKKCKFFVTSHSSVAIDLFAHDDQAQILHVTHNGEVATAKRVTTYVENKGILDDLDVRASDLLQSNGIVWLEGPSDRLYFNRWIEIWSDAKLKEGAHYQCVFYGGRLLAHLSATDPDVDADEVVKILRVNRNAMLILDSDFRQASSTLNATKTRIIQEIESIEGLAWVTMGTEIENYLPTQALGARYENDNLPHLEQYQDFAEYLDSVSDGEGKRFLRNKVLFAEQMLPHITKADLEQTLDLKEMLARVCARISQWNGLA